MLIPASGVKNRFVHKIQIDNYYKRGAFTLAFLLQIKNIKTARMILMNISSLRKIVEKNGELSIEELQRFVSSFIPESCDDCIWLKGKDKSSCPAHNGAPCRIYLNRVLKYLESKGLI